MQRKKLYQKILVFSLFSALCATLNAQERSMRLNELLDLADSNNHTILAYRAATQAAEQSALSAQRQLLPSLSLSASAGYLGNGYGWGRDSIYHFSVVMPHWSTRFGFEASQVIYAGGALRNTMTLAKMGQKMQQLKELQKRQDIRFQLAGLYLDLCQLNNQLRVYDSNIALTARLVADIKNRQEQGTALKNDLTRYELQLSDLSMQRKSLYNGILIINRQIVTLTGLPTDILIVPIEHYSESPEPLATLLPDQTAWTKKVNQAPVVQMADLGVSMAHTSESLERAAMRPRVAVVAQDQLNGPVTIDINPYNVNYNYWYAGLGLQYDISSLYKNRRKIHAAQLITRQHQWELEEAQNQISNAVEAARIRLDESYTNLSTKLKKFDLASQNYIVVENRYRNDLALLTDMLDASNIKLGAELELVNAHINCVYQYYQLQYLCGQF